MKETYLNVRGTVDFSPSQTLIYQKLYGQACRLFTVYGYKQLFLPLLEEKKLFLKGVGANTDIVEKQMMKIEGKDIVLRPEATAQVVRHYLQHRLDKKNEFYKFFYIGPMFRGERPQKGRLRQFNHIGAEVIGSGSFYLDAEVINLANQILIKAGISQKQLQVNSLGCQKDKIKFGQFIKSKLAKKKEALCPNCQKRLETNPLRVVDCKKNSCKKIIADLNWGKEHLCPDCRADFDNLLTALDSLGLDYDYNPCLVRGLDYYTNTVFEFVSVDLGAQDALGAGGRYNNLFNRLGKIDLPAVGFALGVERVMLLLEGKTKIKEPGAVFLARAGEVDNTAFLVLADLREKGIVSDCDFRDKTLKAQLRYAQKNGFKFVVIIGEQETAKNQAVLRNMEDSTQETIDLTCLPEKLKSLQLN